MEVGHSLLPDLLHFPRLKTTTRNRVSPWPDYWIFHLENDTQTDPLPYRGERPPVPPAHCEEPSRPAGAECDESRARLLRCVTNLAIFFLRGTVIHTLGIFTGEKISSLHQYRRWLRDQSRYKRKAGWIDDEKQPI